MLRTYLRINRVGLVGAARLSPERTGKVGTMVRLGSGDAVGRAAPGLLLVWRLLLESCRLGTASCRRGRRLGASRDRKRASRTPVNRAVADYYGSWKHNRTEGNWGLGRPKIPGWAGPPWAPCRDTHPSGEHAFSKLI